jgi:hypothetical protein
MKTKEVLLSEQARTAHVIELREIQQGQWGAPKLLNRATRVPGCCLGD